jgi:cytochrome c-type biogenesis protein CcmH
MTALLLFFSLSASTLSGAYAPQQAGSAPLEPALEARVQKLGKELRCPTCQGLSIADSPASMARAQIDKVRELVSAGKSDEEIRAYFVARYGEWILLSPKAAGINWLVWLGPALLLIFGFVVIARQIRRSPLNKPAGSDNSIERESIPPPTTSPADDDYLRAVRSELER